MRTLRRYIVKEILLATALVLAAVLLLFAFFDLVKEIGDLGRGNYQLRHVLQHVLLSMPTHAYEIFPIAALIGTLFALAQLVASSEYTVMRTAGLSLWRVLSTILSAGVALALLTLAFGEFLGPHAEQWAVQLRSRAISGVIAQEFSSGLWLKDDKSFVNVREITADGQLKGVRIYDFDTQLRLVSVSAARGGVYAGDRKWLLSDVEKTSFSEVRTEVSRSAQEVWSSVLDPRLLNVLTIQPEKMSAMSLYVYSQHLRAHRTVAQDLRAPGIGRNQPADRGRALAAQGEGEAQAVGLCRLVQALQDDTRFANHRAGLGIEAANGHAVSVTSANRARKTTRL